MQDQADLLEQNQIKYYVKTITAARTIVLYCENKVK